MNKVNGLFLHLLEILRTFMLCMEGHNSIRGLYFPFSWKVEVIKTFYYLSVRQTFVCFVLSLCILCPRKKIPAKFAGHWIYERPSGFNIFKDILQNFFEIGKLSAEQVCWDPFPKSFQICACFLKCSIHNSIIRLQLYLLSMYWNIDFWAVLPLQLSVFCSEIHWQIKLRNQHERTGVLLVENDLEAPLITAILGLAHAENSKVSDK